MPEFILEGRDHAARAESPFTLGFIEALFFTNTESSVDSSDWFTPETIEARKNGQLSELPSDVGYSELHPDSLAAIRADCEAWQAANAELLVLAYATGYDEAQAGRDYWSTRNGHGVGFWSRDELDGETDADGLTIGERLANACPCNEVNPFFGDHVTHGAAPFVHVDL